MQRFFEEGVKASSRGAGSRHGEAFLEAWKRKPHYQVAAHLGARRGGGGKPKDAMEHLSVFLREAPASVRREDRQQAQALWTRRGRRWGGWCCG